MAIALDINMFINKKINFLTIVKEGIPHVTSGGHKHRTAICVCICGSKRTMQISSILNGSIKSCGCYSAKGASQRAIIRNTKHNKCNSPEYCVWLAMKKRCFNKNNKSYKYYGGRGITICDRWKNSFENFIADMGYRPSLKHSIDRINVNGNYEPSNCRWATDKQQARNQRTNVLIDYKGQTKCIAEWGEIYKIGWQALYYRIFIGKWDIHKAFNTPLSYHHEA